MTIHEPNNTPTATTPLHPQPFAPICFVPAADDATVVTLAVARATVSVGVAEAMERVDVPESACKTCEASGVGPGSNAKGPVSITDNTADRYWLSARSTQD